MNELVSYIALAVSLLALAAFFWAFGWIRQSQTRVREQLDRLFGGAAEESLGELLAHQGEELRRQETTLQQLGTQLQTGLQELASQEQTLRSYAAGALRHVHLHTYSVGNGGPESAIVVLTDAQGDGFLLTALAGKTVRIYTRPLRRWQGEQLSQDDLQALTAAQAEANE